MLIAPADGFADPPGLAVREDVLDAVGGPEPVFAGALAELVARIEAAGHTVEVRHDRAPVRRPTPGRLAREGAARLWLFRRDAGWRFPFMAVGALRANGLPTRG